MRRSGGAEEEKSMNYIRNNLIYIIIIVYVFFYWVSIIAEEFLFRMIPGIHDLSYPMQYILDGYAGAVWSLLILFLICFIVRKNRFILRSFLPKGKGRGHGVFVVEDTYEPTQDNTVKKLLLGLLTGFVICLLCIACTAAIGDITLSFDFGADKIPMFLFGLVMVMLQSTSEELWFRGFMYERILIRHPLWVAVLVNGVFFGMIHLLNSGVTFLAILNIAICGIGFSILRWYTKSIWLVIGFHTMWNFTQSFIFGLPNSGIVSGISLFHPESRNAERNLIYDPHFGVEGAIILTIIFALIITAVLLRARKQGRLGELRMSYEKMQAG